MIDRRKEKNVYIVFIAAVFAIMAALIAIRYDIISSRLPIHDTSPICNITKRYRDEGILTYDDGSEILLENGDVSNQVYETGSSEFKYLKGLTYYGRQEFNMAARVFGEALENAGESKDKGLLSCIYCYLNLCYTELKGTGNVEYVQNALNAALNSYSVANYHGLMWEVGYTIADSMENDAIVIGLLQNILDNFPNLSLEAKVRYENIIAMLDNIDGNYGKSIRRFYDVQNMLKDVDAQGEVLRQKLFANSYLAGFYYEMEDYENTVKLFEENIAIPVSDPKLNAKAKYSDYINLSSAYLELGDTENALLICDKMEEIYPHLEDYLVLDVRAQVLDTRARVAIIDGDYKLAASYLDDAEELLKSGDSQAFYGNEAFIRLTRCKLMFAQGQVQETKENLEKMVVSGEMSDAGLEDEVYLLLLKCCREVKDTEAFFKYNSELEEYKKYFYKTVQREYLEFSQYYNDNVSLKQTNSLLKNRIQQGTVINAAFLVVIIVIILSSVKIRHAGLLDALTGVNNRKVLTKILKNDPTPQKNTVVMMMDIDHFKKYNDTYGHIMGDDVIKNVAKAIKSSVRKKDIVIRYGGEEFLLILKKLDYDAAFTIGNRILENVRNENIPHKSSDTAGIVTISLGFCFNESESVSLSHMIDKADEALYKSKEGGRNRVSSVKV